jgi:bifunctional UDP-N-acetylglucosamine pyrophosphorylase/glucosamine-1-phosphate N-acetyltransferase
MSVSQAAILAAGPGSKLEPFTETRAPALLPVANEPLLDRLCSQLQERGIEDIVVAIAPNQLGDQLQGHLADRTDVDTVRTEPRGTAPALDACLDELDSEQSTAVVYGDVVTADENLDALWAAFEDERNANGSDEAKTIGACLVDEVGEDDPRGWIGASHTQVSDQPSGERSSGDDAARYVDEFRGHTSNDWRVSGLFLLTPNAWSYVRGNPGIMRTVRVGGMPPLEGALAESMNQALADGRSLRAVPAESYHVDVDKPWHVWEANHRAVTDQVGGLTEDEIHTSATISDDATIVGNVHLGPDCVIGPRAVVNGNLWMEAGAELTNGAIVGDTCLIGRDTVATDYSKLGSGSVVGSGCRLGYNAEFVGVMFDGVHVVHYSKLCGVIGERTDIGAATVSGGLRFDDGRTTHLTHGFREKPGFGANGSYIGDYSRTGVNVTLLPCVTVGSYSCVGPGVIVDEDVPSRTLRTVTQEIEDRSWGPERYGW